MAAGRGEETGETDAGQSRTPLSMVWPAAVLAAASLAVGLVPHLGSVVERAVLRFQDEAGYNAAVLYGRSVAHPAALYPAASATVTLASVLTGVGSVLGSVVLAGLALYWRRLPLLRRGFEPGAGVIGLVRGLQSGVISDYITWLVFGLACVGGAFALAVR
jgi:multicomponent Na+:H+ antiporter subunit D